MDEPIKLVDAFANAAGPSFITCPIPESAGAPGAANFAEGFPPVTMQNPAAGGIPPFGQDVNGILFMTTSVLAYLNQGQSFVYDGTFATAIGGYLKGSIVRSARSDSPGFWLCLTDGTTSDPDAAVTANWAPIGNYGSTTVTTTGGTTTLTAQQAARSFIVVQGALASNAIIVMPTWLEQWLIVNATTGGNSLTVKTAAGTGVAVPAGSFASPTGVYGDGTNIYNAFSPLTVPIDQNATPLTLAERTNSGYLFATYFNQSSSIESVSPGAVFVESGAHDGFLRKMSMTAFAQALIGPGYQIRAGTFNCINGNLTVSFSPAFPTACLAVCLTGEFNGWNLGNVIPGSRAAGSFGYHNSNVGLMDFIAVGN